MRVTICSHWLRGAASDAPLLRKEGFVTDRVLLKKFESDAIEKQQKKVISLKFASLRMLQWTVDIVRS